MKLSLTLILLVCSNLSAQEVDTTSTDTLIILNDTSFSKLDTLAADTTGIFTSRVDTLYPLTQNPFYSHSFFISRETIDLLNYRYTGNLFTPAAFSFLKDKGMIGQPNELVLYGSSSSTGFMSDGVLYNNRFTQSLDLNLFQSESIDSIEILPLPRGFLYGPDNYLVTVNFIEKDFVTPVPYTRIKYYEGPDGEAFVDGIFNTAFLNKFNFYFDISNRNFDGIYDNSDFSIWQTNFKLKYFLSNSINITGSYSLVSSDLGFFGGIDADSISEITNDINSILYDPLFAPVVYPGLRQEAKWDKFKIRALGKFGNFRTDLTFYYHAEQEKYSGIPFNDEIKNYIPGASIRQSYLHSNVKLEVNGAFEKRDLNYYTSDTTTGFQSYKMEYNVFSISPVLSLYLLDSTIVPSLFYKYSDVTDFNEGSHTGLGADINLNFFRWINFYLGFSKFNFLNRYETKVYEVGAYVKLENLNAGLRFYGTDKSLPPVLPSPTIMFPYLTQSAIKKINGYAASINYDFWKVGVEGIFFSNTFDGDENSVSTEIKMHVNSGLYYKDLLFKNNLDLKTGFVLKYYEYESANFESAYQIDFTIAGIIQKT
ncbi:MAG: hypothetical protein EHM47_11815, partial [Ignavibacteriales bacterium]